VQLVGLGPRTLSYVPDLRLFASQLAPKYNAAGHRRASSSPSRTLTLCTCCDDASLAADLVEARGSPILSLSTAAPTTMRSRAERPVQVSASASEGLHSGRRSCPQPLRGGRTGTMCCPLTGLTGMYGFGCCGPRKVPRRRSEHDQAPVPVGLDAGATPAPHADLQQVRKSACGCPEPNCHVPAGHEGKPG
jgi:hypothetical protein